MKNIKYTLILLLLPFMFACEKMEDTYKDYSGDGPIRYISKATNLTIEAGWQRFVLKWDEAKDVTVTKTKIVWYSQAKKDSIVFDGIKSSFDTRVDAPNKTWDNESYKFTIYYLDDEGEQSLPVNVLGVPINENHPAVMAVGNVESKYAYIKDACALILASHDPNISNQKVLYTQGGEQKEYLVTEDDYNINGYVIINDVDPDTEVLISRTATLDICIDPVNFKPYALKRNSYTITPDFAQEMRTYYKVKNLDAAFFASIEDVHLNYTLTDISDILYFSNMTKLSLGADRYLTDNGFGPSMVTNPIISLPQLFSLISTINPDFEIDVYNMNYWVTPWEIPMAVEKETPTIVERDYLESDNWNVISYTDIEEQKVNENYTSNYMNLFDNDYSTAMNFIPREGPVRKHVIDIDLNQIQNVSGVKVAQAAETNWSDGYFRPRYIKIEYSDDNKIWKSAFYDELVQIGAVNEETTFLEMPETIQTQYIRLTIHDMSTDYLGAGLILGDFLLY